MNNIYDAKVTKYGVRKFHAFTLAEILITLVIIGIVAALTIPTLIRDIQYKQFNSSLKQAYSILVNAVSYLHSQDVYIHGKTYYTANSIATNSKESTFAYVFFQAFKNPYSKKNLLSYYGIPAGIDINTQYLTLDGNNYFADYLLDDGFAQLSNGMSIMIETSEYTKFPIITVDLNGINKKPNRAGYDMFSFVIDKNDVVYPIGHPKASVANNANRFCNFNLSDELINGFTCAYKAFYDRDYWENLKN